MSKLFRLPILISMAVASLALCAYAQPTAALTIGSDLSANPITTAATQKTENSFPYFALRHGP